MAGKSKAQVKADFKKVIERAKAIREAGGSKTETIKKKKYKVSWKDAQKKAWTEYRLKKHQW